MKLKLKGHQCDTNEAIQAESQRVLDTLTEQDFQEAFQKNGQDSGTGVYVQEGTTSWVMAADRPYGEFYDSQRQSGIFWIPPHTYRITHNSVHQELFTSY
jgi:hypothetical protein